MSPEPKTIFLFANGPLASRAWIPPLLGCNDMLIAVDGGLAHLADLGLAPDLIIGDLDSADPQQVQHYREQDIEIRQFPIDKDQTDLELAIDAALHMLPGKIRILGALGGRIDQTLGNIFLLTQSKLEKIDIRLINGDQEAFLIWNTAQLEGQPGQRVSLLPLQGAVTGIRTHGLKYPLEDETLYPDQTRGISNLMEQERAAIEIEHGKLLCFHEFSIESP